ncbi:MAG: GntR family transcriptional regulator, partial [Desulfobacterales bacterium]
MTDNVDFEPLINKRTLSAQVFDRLYSAILSARIEPGSKLKINQLAETLEVSVMPVREALRHLESAGLVTFTPNKKILVNEISKEDLEDVYFVLAPLEEFSLEKAFN